MNGESCRTCRFSILEWKYAAQFDETINENNYEDEGYANNHYFCRRFPPTVKIGYKTFPVPQDSSLVFPSLVQSAPEDGYSSIWPTVDQDDWCGEWKGAT
jgi:hypothetical protein